MAIPKVVIVCSCGGRFTRLGMRTHLRNNPGHKEISRYSSWKGEDD